MAGGLRGLGRARTFGSTSAGMALPAAMTRLPSGDVLMHAIADYESSDGARLEYHGVPPDEPVPVTREELLGGVDAPLRAAAGWVAEPQRRMRKHFTPRSGVRSRPDPAAAARPGRYTHPGSMLPDRPSRRNRMRRTSASRLLAAAGLTALSALLGAGGCSVDPARPARTRKPTTPNRAWSSPISSVPGSWSATPTTTPTTTASTGSRSATNCDPAPRRPAHGRRGDRSSPRWSAGSTRATSR
jgi:hypothetical protein